MENMRQVLVSSERMKTGDQMIQMTDLISVTKSLYVINLSSNNNVKQQFSLMLINNNSSVEFRPDFSKDWTRGRLLDQQNHDVLRLFSQRTSSSFALRLLDCLSADRQEVMTGKWRSGMVTCLSALIKVQKLNGLACHRLATHPFCCQLAFLHIIVTTKLQVTIVLVPWTLGDQAIIGCSSAAEKPPW